MEVAIEEDSQLLRMGRSAIRKSRILSEINEDSRTNSGKDCFLLGSNTYQQNYMFAEFVLISFIKPDERQNFKH